MALSGFEPELEACAGCGSGDAVFFSVADAGVYCENCAAPRRASGERVYPLYPAALDAMRYIREADLPRLFSFSLGDGRRKISVPLRALYARTDGAQL